MLQDVGLGGQVAKSFRHPLDRDVEVSSDDARLGHARMVLQYFANIIGGSRVHSKMAIMGGENNRSDMLEIKLDADAFPGYLKLKRGCTHRNTLWPHNDHSPTICPIWWWW